jgi:hypothetical protein
VPDRFRDAALRGEAVVEPIEVIGPESLHGHFSVRRYEYLAALRCILY